MRNLEVIFDGRKQDSIGASTKRVGHRRGEDDDSGRGGNPGEKTGLVNRDSAAHQDLSKFDPDPFFKFHRFLEQSFPSLHKVLERKVINDCSLLYKWQGSDPELKLTGPGPGQ